MGRKYARQYKRNYLSRQGNGWRFVRAIPRDLQALERKKTWTKYLGVVSNNEAEIEARKLASHYDARIVKLRKLSKADSSTVADAGGLEAFASETRAIEERYAFEATAVELMPITTNVEYPGNAARYLQDVAEWTDAANASAAALTPRRRILADTGTVSKLAALVDVYVAENKPRNPKTVQKAHLYVRRFVSACGDIEARAVTRGDALKYRDALDRDAKLSKSGVVAHLDKMRAMFNTAIGEEKLGVTTNPFSLVESRKENTNEEKLPFTLLQVGDIVEHCRRRATDAYGVEFELVTRILAYHGARSGEISQLTVKDVTESYGVPVFDIHARNGSLKDGAARLLPIHPECLGTINSQVENVREGAALAPDGSPWLFPSIVGAKVTERGGKYHRAGSKFLRGVVGIKNKSLTMHGLRHTFRDLCRETLMPTDISASLMGHSLGKGHHGATYGTGVSIKMRAAWLAKISLT